MKKRYLSDKKAIVLPFLKAIFLFFKTLWIWGLAEILLFISLHITFPCNTESPVKPGPSDLSFDPYHSYHSFWKYPLSLRTNLNKTTFLDEPDLPEQWGIWSSTVWSPVKSNRYATGPASRGAQGIQPLPAHHQYLPENDRARFWKHAENRVLIFSAQWIRALHHYPSASALSTAVQPRCTSLQNFAFCAIADRLQRPTAHLGCRIVCTTFESAQKKDTRPVGGRGISAF